MRLIEMIAGPVETPIILADELIAEIKLITAVSPTGHKNNSIFNTKMRWVTESLASDRLIPRGCQRREKQTHAPG